MRKVPPPVPGVADDGAEDGVSDGGALDFEQVDGVPGGAGRGETEGDHLPRQEEDGAQAEVGAGVGVGDGGALGERGAEGMDLVRCSSGDRSHLIHQSRERRRRALSPHLGSTFVARCRMGAKKARPQRRNRALHAQFRRPASSEACALVMHPIFRYHLMSSTYWALRSGAEAQGDARRGQGALHAQE